MSTHRLSAACFVICLLFVRGNAAAEAPLTPGQTSEIDAQIEAIRKQSGTPAISLAIARNGTLVYAKGYGLRDVDAKLATDADTVFEIGSVTKQFTAAAVMLLVESGKVRLDSPVAAYLSGIPFGDRITVRQLLAQTSGLANYTDSARFDAFSNTAPSDPRAILTLVAGKPLHFTPGTKWEYSNTNYAILGLLIAEVSHQSYPAFLESHIFVPMGLTHTRYSSKYLDSGNVALPYDLDEGRPTPVTRTNLNWAYAAGGLWSNAPDLVRWEQKLYEGRLVDADSLEEMTTATHLPDGTSTNYGFGLMCTTLYGRREIWHTGGLPGYSSVDAEFPDEHMHVAVLANVAGADPSRVLRSVAAITIPAIGRAIAADASATASPDEDLRMTALAKSLLSQAQSGKVDATLFTSRMNAALTPAMVDTVAQQIAPLGTPINVRFMGETTNGMYKTYRYRIVWPSISLDETFALDPDGKIAGWFFKPAADAAPSPAPSPDSSPSTAASPSP